MRRRVCAAGSSSGFTLLEVVVATVLLAAAAVGVVTAYVHAVTQATAARDLTIATSVARNALNEGLAGVAAPAEAVSVPQRPALFVWYEEKLGEEMEEIPLADTLIAFVREGEGGDVVRITGKRALYIMPEAQDDGVGDPVDEPVDVMGDYGYGAGGDYQDDRVSRPGDDLKHPAAPGYGRGGGGGRHARL